MHAGGELGTHMDEVDHVQPHPHVSEGVVGDSGIGGLIEQGRVCFRGLLWEDVDWGQTIKGYQNHHHTHLGKCDANNEDRPEGWQRGQLVANNGILSKQLVPSSSSPRLLLLSHRAKSATTSAGIALNTVGLPSSLKR